MVIATISGFELELVHIAMGLGAAGASVVSYGVASGKMQVKDLLNFDFSASQGPERHVEETKEAVLNAEPDPGAKEDQQMRSLKKNIAREIDHGIRSSYTSGKMDGMQAANNEDKHYKATLMAVFGVMGLLLFEMGVYFGLF